MIIYKSAPLKNKYKLIVKINHVCLCVDAKLKNADFWQQLSKGYKVMPLRMVSLTHRAVKN